jgi:hypothetical protein
MAAVARIAAAWLLTAGAIQGQGAPAEVEIAVETTYVGNGAHRHRWVDRALQLPDGEPLGATHGKIAVDASGRIYLQTDTARAVCVFGPDGRFERSFGEQWQGGLHGLDLVREGEREVLYLSHLRQGAVYKVSLEGELLQTFDYPAESGLYEHRDQYHPTAVAVTRSGELYVADGYGRSYVHRYAADGRHLGAVIGPGRELGQVRNPHELELVERGGRTLLLVADRENRRLQWFDLEGRFVAAWSQGLRRPTATALRGEVLAVADIDGGVVLLDLAGQVLAELGAHPDAALRDRNDVPTAQQRPGLFHSPHGLCFAPDGSLYVVEWLLEGRVTRLVPEP